MREYEPAPIVRHDLIPESPRMGERVMMKPSESGSYDGFNGVITGEFDEHGMSRLFVTLDVFGKEVPIECPAESVITLEEGDAH